MAENYGTLEGTLDEHGVLSGEMDDRATLEGEIQFGSGGGGVLDVFQNGQSVVEGRYAYVTVPTFLRELRSDDYHNTVTSLEMQIWNGKADPSDIPTALSQLDNDANYVQDADYVHTDNNFTDEDKAAIGNIPENVTDLSDVAVDNIQNGQVLKWDATQEKFVNADESGGGGDVTDVKVNNASVVDAQGVANIDLSGYAETSDIPTDLADLSDDATHRLVTDTEKSTWDNKADVSDIPTVNNNTITIQKNGQNVDTFTLNQTTDKVIDIPVPTKTSDLQNDSSFITNTVNNLANYYLKTQTYTQAEVDALIDAAVNGRFQKVNVLPATGEPNIIYLVPKATPETSNACDEYIWQDNDWELIGSTDIDLSGYVTDEDLTTALADYLTTSAFNTAIANYYTKTEIGTLLDGKVDKETGKGLSTNDYDNTAKGIVDGVTSALAGKVDKVTGKGLSTNDYDDTDKAKVGKIDLTKTHVTGNPISITTESAQMASGTIIRLNPIETGSGTKSPANPWTISGQDKIEVLSGSNLLYRLLDNCSINGSGVIVSYTGVYIFTAKVKNGKTYTFSSTSTANKGYAFYTNEPVEGASSYNGRTIFNTKSLTFTAPIDGYVAFSLTLDMNGGIIDPENIATNILLSLGQTVYGAYLDLEKGVLLVTHKMVDMGDSTWVYRGSSDGVNYFNAPFADMLATAGKHSFICECYDSVAQRGTNYTISRYNIYDTSAVIYVNDNRYSGDATGAAALKVALSGVKLVYELATPFEIQLTPREISLILGYNYISTNCDEIDTYYKEHGEVASAEDVGNLASMVNELGDYVGRNKYETTVNLNDRVSADNKYEFPYDGYVYISSETVTTGSIRVIITAHNSTQNIAYMYMNITSVYERQSLFVKKGMGIYLQAAIPDGTRVRYIPFM